MSPFIDQVRRIAVDDQGLETVEYAILLGILVVGILGSLAVIGAFVSGAFQSAATGLGA